jgi:hypothetical protein
MSDTTWDCKFQKACVPRHIGTQGARCGERWLAPVALRPIGQRLAETGAAVDAEAGRIDLVPRELEILRLLAGGYSNKGSRAQPRVRRGDGQELCLGDSRQVGHEGSDASGIEGTYVAAHLTVFGRHLARPRDCRCGRWRERSKVGDLRNGA